ncbi:uncharacterized protein LOC135224134 [Macrobrachium nipponense]|uniref:uncharacterized protein LOC135224134 n=1 Tax=Macrobrachium nipponense TaxID=159736 RepID=UPI0030C8CCBD
MGSRSECYELRQVLQQEELATLAVKIKTDLPYSAFMHNNLLIASRGHNEGFQFEFYVPNTYPDSHIVIWSRTTDVSWSLSMHCSEGEVPLLLRLVKATGFASLVKEKPLCLCHLSSYLVDPVTGALQQILRRPFGKYPNPTFTYLRQQTYPLRCPAGMKVQRLGRAGVRHLLEQSKFKKKEPVDLFYALTRNAPALGVFLDPSVKEDQVILPEGIDFADERAMPIAWVGTYEYGTIGMLMTDAGYRRRGLGRLLTELLGRLLLADGYIPHANVEPHNEISLRMFEKLEGWEDTHSCTWIY